MIDLLAYLVVLFFIPAALGEASLILIVLASGACDWAVGGVKLVYDARARRRHGWTCEAVGEQVGEPRKPVAERSNPAGIKPGPTRNSSDLG